MATVSVAMQVAGNGVGAEKLSLDAVRRRMEYWHVPEPGEKRLFPELPGMTRYLTFDPDGGGLNNIRLGWEMAGFIAAATGRTLVLPPPRPWYLLDTEGGMFSRVEDFVDLAQLKRGIPTLTFEEFVLKEGKELRRRGFSSKVPSWGRSPAYAPQMGHEWFEFARAALDQVGPHEECQMRPWHRAGRFAHAPEAETNRIFLCSAWWDLGQPNFDLGRYQNPDWSYRLLKDHFVWHPKFFDMAAPVVQHLGLFRYFAVHARYGDFQFKASRQSPEKVVSFMAKLPGSLGPSRPTSLLQLGSKRVVAKASVMAAARAAAKAAARARARGQRLMRSLEGLIPAGATVYIATDDASSAFLDAFKAKGIKAVRWVDLVAQKGGLLAAAQAKYSDVELKKLSGPVEQLICAHARLFVESDRSTFSGYITRMRMYNGAPQSVTRLKHTAPMSGAAEMAIVAETGHWDRTGGWRAFKAEEVTGILPKPVH